jgi:hypothetical protein
MLTQPDKIKRWAQLCHFSIDFYETHNCPSPLREDRLYRISPKTAKKTYKLQAHDHSRQVQCDWHWSHETNTRPPTFCKEVLYWISWKDYGLFSRWYKVQVNGFPLHIRGSFLLLLTKHRNNYGAEIKWAYFEEKQKLCPHLTGISYHSINLTPLFSPFTRPQSINPCFCVNCVSWNTCFMWN